MGVRLPHPQKRGPATLTPFYIRLAPSYNAGAHPFTGGASSQAQSAVKTHGSPKIILSINRDKDTLTYNFLNKFTLPFFVCLFLLISRADKQGGKDVHASPPLRNETMHRRIVKQTNGRKQESKNQRGESLSTQPTRLPNAEPIPVQPLNLTLERATLPTGKKNPCLASLRNAGVLGIEPHQFQSSRSWGRCHFVNRCAMI